MIEADTWCPDVVTQVPRPPGPCKKWPSACSTTTCAIASDTPRYSAADGDQVLAEVTGAIRQVVRL